MAATAQSLFTETECLGCVWPQDNAQRLRIGLLLTILSDLGVTMTPQELLDEATCYICLDGVSQADGIELALLNQIQENIAGGGGGGGEAGVGSPEGVVTANPGTTYVDTSTGNFWVKQTGVGNTGWLQLIG